MVQTCTSAPRECIWESELLYGIEYLFSGFGSGVEVHLRKPDLLSGSGPNEDASFVDDQSVPFRHSVGKNVQETEGAGGEDHCGGSA